MVIDYHKVIDLRNLKDMSCSDSKLETFQIYIIEHSEPGDIVELIIGEADTWYTLKNLGNDLGYEILSSNKVNNSEYRLLIRVI